MTDTTIRTRPLVLSPFRGLRYAPDQVSDLAAVTSPPYDVLDRDSIARLTADEPHNIVRVILPRHARLPEPGGGTGSSTTGSSTTGSSTTGSSTTGEDATTGQYHEAAELLRSWRAAGVLIVDREPSLYVYELHLQRPDQIAASTSGLTSDVPSAGYVLRGLLGAVSLHAADERVILPHEDVLPGIVADRLALMRSCAANLEPILLSYDGGGAATDLVEATASGQPMLQAQTPDGTRHRLWRLTDPDRIAEIATDLAPRQAMIADGHHRYATYLQLRDELRASGAGAGPWDNGLALLVDRRVHPLQLSAIHRLVAGIGLAEALERLNRPPFKITNYGGDSGRAREALAACRGTEHGYLLTDGDSWILARIPRGQIAVRSGRLAERHGREVLDTEILHEFVFDHVLGVSDERIGYAHDVAAAIRLAREEEQLAVLLNPVEFETVESVARAGGRMPRKSTSFGPKPRTGFVMLDFADN